MNLRRQFRWWALVIVLGAVAIVAITTHRSFAGTFEAPLPAQTGSQVSIAKIEREIARLEAAGKLTARLRQQLNKGLAAEKLLQAGAVFRLTLNSGTALLEYVSPGAPTTTTAHDLRYAVTGFGTGRRIHFEPLGSPTGFFDPPADFVIENDDVIRSTGSNLRFQRVAR